MRSKKSSIESSEEISESGPEITAGLAGGYMVFFFEKKTEISGRVDLFSIPELDIAMGTRNLPTVVAQTN